MRATTPTSVTLKDKFLAFVRGIGQSVANALGLGDSQVGIPALVFA